MAVGIALTLLLALIVVLLVQSDFGAGDNAAPTLDVPAVIGVPYGQAEAALKSLGFTVQRVDEDAPYQAPELVLAQNPEQGRKIPKGGLIALTVSSPTITIPDVVGQTKENAASALAKVNLSPKFVEGDSDQPPGTVLGTYPGAGGKVDKAASGPATVAVLVAREPAVPVPDVAGQDPYPALLTLGGASFQVTVVPTPSDTVPSGKVIGTDPAAGTPLPRGSAVKLLVSSGAAAVNVPNVVGQTKAVAEAVLTGAGFSVRETFVNAGPSKTGTIVSQSPSGGSAPKGALVAVTIGL